VPRALDADVAWSPQPASTGPSGTPPAEQRPKRPQPIRDKIIAFLTKPRSAVQIATNIERPVPIATGHLAAMRRLGLVQRIGYSAYASASYQGPPVRFGRRRSEAEPSLRRRLRILLRVRSSVVGLRCRTGSSDAAIHTALHELWLSGLVSGDDKSSYLLVVSDLLRQRHKYARAVRKFAA
jgi:hypothetical protein